MDRPQMVVASQSPSEAKVWAPSQRHRSGRRRRASGRSPRWRGRTRGRRHLDEEGHVAEQLPGLGLLRNIVAPLAAAEGEAEQRQTQPEAGERCQRQLGTPAPDAQLDQHQAAEQQADADGSGTTSSTRSSHGTEAMPGHPAKPTLHVRTRRRAHRRNERAGMPARASRRDRCCCASSCKGERMGPSARRRPSIGPSNTSPAPRCGDRERRREALEALRDLEARAGRAPEAVRPAPALSTGGPARTFEPDALSGASTLTVRSGARSPCPSRARRFVFPARAPAAAAAAAG